MLLHLPRKYRSEDDDYAPRDYSYVGSVAEGARRKEAAPIHQQADRAGVRHRADPTIRESDNPQGAVATTPDKMRGYEAARHIPRSGEAAPAARVAYPRPRDNGFAQTPTYAPTTPQALPMGQAPRVGSRSARDAGSYVNPADIAAISQDGVGRMGDAPRPGANRRAAAHDEDHCAQPDTQRQNLGRESLPAQTFAPPIQQGDLFAADGSQYAPPSVQDMPEWLRVAQQNNVPFFEDRQRRTPRVESAPQQPQEPAPTDLLGRPIARRSPPPQTQCATPTCADDYEAAGYPPELIAQMRGADQAQAQAMGVGRKRHGAQLASPPPRGQATQTRSATNGAPRKPTDELPTREEYARIQAQEAAMGDMRRNYAPRNDFAPRNEQNDPSRRDEANPYTILEPQTKRDRREWQDNPEDEDIPTPRERIQLPWLGIGVTFVALLLVGLWILGMTFASQQETILQNRTTASARLVTNHPYSYRELIEREATANNLHPAFVAAIVLNESSFNPQAESDVGARGLMQMMPDTAEWVHGKMGLTDEYSFDLMYDPDTNVKYACWYLAFLSERFRNDPVLVAASFHAGQNTVQNWLNDSRYSTDGKTITLSKMAEGPTKNYATRVLKAFAVYRRLYYEGGLNADSTADGTTGDAQSGGVITVQ